MPDVGLEDQRGEVLGLDRARDAVAVAAGERARLATRALWRGRPRSAPSPRRSAGRTRTRPGRTSASRCRRTRASCRRARARPASCRPRARAASPAGSRRGSAAGRPARRLGRGRGPRGRSGSSGRRMGPWRRGRCARRRGELGGAGGVEGDRLLADDVLARLEGGGRERHVQVVGRADVDDVDLVGGDQLARRSRRRARPAARPRARCALSGEEAATPASRAPARRAERACTRPMNPAPITPARSAAGVGSAAADLRIQRDRASLPRHAANLFHFCMLVKQKLRRQR